MSTETDPIDIKLYRLEGKPYEPPPIKTKKTQLYEPGTWFIAAMPGAWIAEAAKLPGRTLHVALAIMYVHGMERRQTIELTRYHFNRFNIPRGSIRRGLDALQQAKLIEYTIEGHTYTVTVIPTES
jgi:hypothetical protein